MLEVLVAALAGGSCVRYCFQISLLLIGILGNGPLVHGAIAAAAALGRVAAPLALADFLLLFAGSVARAKFVQRRGLGLFQLFAFGGWRRRRLGFDNIHNVPVSQG